MKRNYNYQLSIIDSFKRASEPQQKLHRSDHGDQEKCSSPLAAGDTGTLPDKTVTDFSSESASTSTGDIRTPLDKTVTDFSSESASTSPVDIRTLLDKSHKTVTDFSLEPVSVSAVDIGTELAKSIADADKYQLLRHHFKPSSQYKFTLTKYAGRSRTFQLAWLDKYNGLVYSPCMEGAFCTYCSLFAECSVGQLVKKPLTDMAHAHQKLSEHFGGTDGKPAKKMHIQSREKALNFLSVMENKMQSIHVEMDSIIAKRIQKNRNVLKSIIKCVLFCGKQNIALRGHRDNSQHLGGKANAGNFQALLDFRLDSGDVILMQHLNTTGKNCTYRSKTIQNEVIDVLKVYITNKLAVDIKEAGVFSLSADEKADRANEEQLTVCLRCVDSNADIREVFMGFVNVSGSTTGAALAKTLKETVQEWGIDMQFCRGQTYDGASNMSGSINGTAAIIQRDYPLAAYTHCASHCLNLVLSQCSKQQMVRNMVDSAEKVVVFFNSSPKRNTNLQVWIKEACPTSGKSKLIESCTTRFIERHEAFEVFCELYLAIEQSLCDMANNRDYNRDTNRDAQALHSVIRNFQFLITLVIVKNCMGYTKPLSVNLQGRSQDVIHAYQSINEVVATIRDVRQEIDSKFTEWFEEACEMGKHVSVEPNLPRTCNRQQNRANTPASTPEDYYRRTLAIPYLDELVSEIERRFSSFSKMSVTGLNLIPEIIYKCKDPVKERVQEIIKLYATDLPSPLGVSVELELWERKWRKTESNHPSTANDTLKACRKQDFPNIHQLLTNICTIGVTSCEAERANSELTYLKTYLRATMGQERLTGLALMHVHYGMEINIEEVVNIFARSHPRRLRLINMIDSD